MAWLLVFGLVIAGLATWIRLAPSDPGRWHLVRDVSENRDLRHGVVRVVPGDADRLARLDALIRATPRSRALTGSVEEGAVTYITRSAVWGFPDYTTIALLDDRLVIFARARFGASDLGVNRTRVQGWLAELDRASP